MRSFPTRKSDGSDSISRAEACSATPGGFSTVRPVDAPPDGQPEVRRGETIVPENAAGYEAPLAKTESVFALRDDVIFPSSNEWGLPDLLPNKLSRLTPDLTYFGKEFPVEDASRTFAVWSTFSSISVSLVELTCRRSMRNRSSESSRVFVRFPLWTRMMPYGAFT